MVSVIDVAMSRLNCGKSENLEVSPCTNKNHGDYHTHCSTVFDVFMALLTGELTIDDSPDELKETILVVDEIMGGRF